MKGVFLTVYSDVSPATDCTNDCDVLWPWDRAAAVGTLSHSSNSKTSALPGYTIRILQFQLREICLTPL